jgi:hypothetical protein
MLVITIMQRSAATHLRKTAFLSHLCIKTIILPRQARDKHRENSKKDAVFPTQGFSLHPDDTRLPAQDMAIKVCADLLKQRAVKRPNIREGIPLGKRRASGDHEINDPTLANDRV